MSTLFKNITLVTMNEKNEVLKDMYLGVEEDKIIYISNVKPKNKFKREINGKGNVIMPGLINCHTHIPMTLLRGYADDVPLQTWLNKYILKAESKFTDEMIEVGSKLAIAEMLSTGTTSFTDMYFKFPVIADVINDIGIRANICNPVVCLENEYKLEQDNSYLEFVKVYEKYKNHNLINIDTGIHGEYTSIPSAWKKWVEIAKKHKLNIHLHLSETLKEHNDCKEKYGKTPTQIFYENGVFKLSANLAHCVFVEDKDLEIIKKSNANVVYNPISNLKLGSGIANVNKMKNMGINVCIGTDGVASNNSLDLFEEIKIAGLLQKGVNMDASIINSKEVLEMATLNGAKSQNRDNIGKISIGMKADLIMIDFNNINHTPTYDVQSALVYNTNGKDVIMTMVNGKILYENGEFTTINITEVINKMNIIKYKIIEDNKLD